MCLTCVRRKEAAGGAEALTQSVRSRLGRRVQRHRQEVVEVDGMGLTLDQAGQAAARRLQALLLQDLADAGVHAWVPGGQGHTSQILKEARKCSVFKPSAKFRDILDVKSSQNRNWMTGRRVRREAAARYPSSE